MSVLLWCLASQRDMSKQSLIHQKSVSQLVNNVGNKLFPKAPGTTRVSPRCTRKGILFVVMTLSVHRHVFLPMMTYKRRGFRGGSEEKQTSTLSGFFFSPLLTHLSFATCLRGTSLILFTIRGIFFPSLLHAAALLFDISIRSCHAHWRQLKIRSCLRQKYCTELSECKSTEEAPESIMMFFLRHTDTLGIWSSLQSRGSYCETCFYGLLHKKPRCVELMILPFEMRLFVFLKRRSVTSFFFSSYDNISLLLRLEFKLVNTWVNCPFKLFFYCTAP